MAKQDITGPFGSAVPTVAPEVPEAGVAGVIPFEDGPAVPFNDDTLQGEARTAEARKVREARAAVEDASVLDVVKAGVSTWDTTRLVDRIARPGFEEATLDFNTHEFIENIPMALTEDEHEYVLATAKGPKSAEYALQVVRDRRDAHAVAGQRPVVGFLSQVLDPVWLGVPPALKVGKLTGTAGRVVSGAGSAAIAGGITVAGEGPVEDEAIVLNMLTAGALGTVLYKPGKGLVDADPDLPTRVLEDSIDAARFTQTERVAMRYREATEQDLRARLIELERKRDGTPDTIVKDEDGIERKIEGDRPVIITPDEKVEIEQLTAVLIHREKTLMTRPGNHKFSTFLESAIASTDPVVSKAARTLKELADPAVWDMPVRLSGNARAYVSHDGFAVLRKDSTPFVVLHEAVHVATIRPIQTFLDGNADTLGKQTRKGVEGLNRLFKQLREEWEFENGKKAGKDSPEHTEYAFKNLHEFTAQAASSETFQKWLAARAGTAKGQNAWKELLQHIAEILGIKATGTKLDEVLDELNTLLTARDTKYVDRSGKEVAFSPKFDVQKPFLHEFSNAFTEEAINNAKRYAGSADSSKGRLVMMPIDDFLRLAYPRSRTYKDLKPGQIEALAEEKRGPIRAAMNKGGLDEVPFLTLDGDKVVGHEGRHRADVLREQFFDEIPVVLKGNVPAPGTKLISETGEESVTIPNAVLRDSPAPAMMPEELRPGAMNTDRPAVVAAVDSRLTQVARKVGRKVEWNMHKTMTNFGNAGKKVADLLFDNNRDLSRHSVESHREAILHDLRRTQVEYENLLRAAMAEEGAGLLQMLNPLTSRKAYAKQAEIERKVQRELFRRETRQRQGMSPTNEGVDPKIAAMADKLDEGHKRALAEMKAAGVEGAENILERPGYLNRKWNSQMIDEVIEKFEGMGLDKPKAKAKVVDLVAMSLKRANDFDDKIAKQISGAIVDRAMRRGYFEDSLFNAPAGEGTLKELRDILSESMSAADVERALNVLRVQSDEAGKAGMLKHRMDLDYDVSVRVGDETVSIMDLIDSRVTNIVDQYNQRAATQVAFARKGLKKRSDIEALRTELLHDTPLADRAQAKELFDNVIAHYRGEPAGQAMNEHFRLMGAYGRSISLAWSGLWQMTEYATAMGEYGLMKSLKYAMQEMPGFKQLMRPDADSAKSLDTILADHSVQSLRMRPFLSRFEDGFEMRPDDKLAGLQLASQSIGQAVPFANAMKYVHHHQARMVGNLILDRVRMAVGGNAKARAALQKYGLEAPVMDKLAREIELHGFTVDKWDAAVWAEVRPAFAKMMDASVLKGRLGDMPAFAVFDNVGKFLFTYRTFVLTAHNKVLLGGIERNGAGAVGLVLMYQFPLALAAVQARSVVMGEGVLEDGELAKTALGQMGGLGLLSEPVKWITGQSNAVGAPGLIPLDRGVKLFQAATNLDAEQTASTALTMLPVVSAIPFMKGMSAQIKEE